MTKSTKAAAAAPVVDATGSAAAAADLSTQMATNPAFKELLASMVKEQAAAVAADAVAAAAAAPAADLIEFGKMAELDAKLAELDAKIATAAAAEKSAKRRKPAAAPAYVAVAYVPQEIKLDKVSGEPLTGKRAGVWPAKCAITPAKYADKRPTWVNAEILRTVLDNVKDAKAVLAKCDAANAAE